MALGNHPAFLASAIRPDMAKIQAKPVGKPATSQTPLYAGFNFTMQSQTQSNWCSPAVAVSISQYYTPDSTWSQCTVVNAALNSTLCCTMPSDPVCNVGIYLDDTLGVTDSFVSCTGPIPEETVYAELLLGRPIALHINWEGGGAHAIVLNRYYFFMGYQRYDLQDPFYGAIHVIAHNLYFGYLGSGTWAYSYYTQAPTS